MHLAEFRGRCERCLAVLVNDNDWRELLRFVCAEAFGPIFVRRRSSVDEGNRLQEMRPAHLSAPLASTRGLMKHAGYMKCPHHMVAYTLA